MTQKDAPYFNLGAVTRETGLHPDTLRAWERRYNLPQPTRSEGGQRLYTQRDLEIVQWLVQQQEAGMRISQAVELFNAQMEAGEDPLAEQRRPEPMLPQIPTGAKITAFRDAWVEAALAFDNMGSENILNEAFSLFPVEAVCDEVLFGGLHEIGEGWYRGEVTVQQEHFASGLVTRRLNALIAGTPPPILPERIVVGAPPEEDHTLSGLMLTLMLRRAGYDVINLGADVPLAHFRETIERLRPEMVLLTAHSLVSAASMLEMADTLEGLNLHLGYGGPVFGRVRELTAVMPGTYLGDALPDAMKAVAWMFETEMVPLTVSTTSPAPYYEDLKARMPEIVLRVAAMFREQPFLVKASLEYLAENLLAAGRLGRTAHLESDLAWVAGLMEAYEIPEGLLGEFLKGFAAAVEAEMEHGSELGVWLRSAASGYE